MSTTSAIGSGGSSAWADVNNARASAMKARMFAKADTDGSGGVDQTELQTLFDKIAKKTGTTAADASQQFSKMDSNGDGQLSSDELATGLKSLMPAPGSTVGFAQQRAGGGGGPPPPPGGGGEGGAQGVSSRTSSTGGSSNSSSSSSTDPLDTNGDGVVSAQERAAGAVKDLVKQLYAQAASDSAPVSKAPGSSVSLAA